MALIPARSGEFWPSARQLRTCASGRVRGENDLRMMERIELNETLEAIA